MLKKIGAGQARHILYGTISKQLAQVFLSDVRGHQTRYTSCSDLIEGGRLRHAILAGAVSRTRVTCSFIQKYYVAQCTIHAFKISI